MAVAVDTPVGLLAPVLRDPDLVAVAELDLRVRELAAQARAGRLAVRNLSGACGTVLNLGAMGMDSGHVPLTSPQATALAVGAVTRQPVFDREGVVARARCRIGLTADQRVVDAPDAARLLASLRSTLADPGRVHRKR